MTQAMKRCPDCGRWLPLNCYHRNRTGRDGREGVCKACKRGRANAYRERRLACAT